MKSWISVGALLALTACAEPELAANEGEASAEQSSATSESTSASASASASSDGTAQASAKASSEGVSFADSETKNGAEREFSYAWPAAVSAIPELAAEFTKQRDADLAAQKREWADQIANCPPASASCASNMLTLDWQVVADTPRFLSLSSGFYTYGGGAHGLSGRGSLIWDRKAKTSLDPYDFFTSLEALEGAVGEKACTLLNKEREKRREGPVTPGEWPDQCVAMGDETKLFLGSSNGTTFDRIGIYYGPYIAGPYAEGDFEFTVPVDKAVIGAVKVEYRDAFSIK